MQKYKFSEKKVVNLHIKNLNIEKICLVYSILKQVQMSVR